ncbi:Glutamine--fructose-6-phosphate aminotransferase [isomerizing] [Buchnera aphidicola (Neophyllaphis podocarpi)]|uniref:glutamine--fructose-6-phosphate transaminase (isomerizing) n=1 Tax=Buchnera aphidicola TaxID=9 RepID=UPI0031B82148
MCGIICAVSKHNILNILQDGLRYLEYRGYDSSGLVIANKNLKIFNIIKSSGKTINLIKKIKNKNISGNIGMAHTRWATHGKPSEKNAHPHISNNIIVVHNGIIENYENLKIKLKNKGYKFSSETDTEVIAHLIHLEQKRKGGTLLEIVQKTLKKIKGTYGLVVMDKNNLSVLIAARSGSPLWIGLGIQENFISSDQLALLQVTKKLIYLEEGDVAEITKTKVKIFDKKRKLIERKKINSKLKKENIKKGIYKYYMQKEIYEQPKAIKNTIYKKIKNNSIDLSQINIKTQNIFKKIKHVQIVACGTSYNSSMVAKYWFEDLANIACDIEIASEFRYRKVVVRDKSLFIAISQSGETADTLEALKISKKLNYIGSLAICNIDGSSLIKESNFNMLTKAGIEVGVASTKAFTTQLALLLVIIASIIQIKKNNMRTVINIINCLKKLPNRIKQILKYKNKIKNLAKKIYNKKYIILLGRGINYPIAIEGALKLKEITYINAEAYAAGELKHGPIALIEKNVPIIVIAPNNKLIEKIKSNIEEVSSRGASVYIFTDNNSHFKKNMRIIKLPCVEDMISPIFYSIPMQLLAYYIAEIKGNDIDKPRNLAKSVTVE